MTDFGDHEHRDYTLVLPDRSETHDVDGMLRLAVSEGAITSASIVPIPMTPEEVINGIEDMGEMAVLYMELITLDGREHRVMFREDGVRLLMTAIQQFTIKRLELNIERTGSPETINLMHAIRDMMEKIERERGDSES